MYLIIIKKYIYIYFFKQFSAISCEKNTKHKNSYGPTKWLILKLEQFLTGYNPFDTRMRKKSFPGYFLASFRDSHLLTEMRFFCEFRKKCFKTPKKVRLAVGGTI